MERNEESPTSRVIADIAVIGTGASSECSNYSWLPDDLSPITRDDCDDGDVGDS